MFYNSIFYRTLLNLGYVKLYWPFNFVNQFNVANLDNSTIPVWAELDPAQPQLVLSLEKAGSISPSPGEESPPHCMVCHDGGWCWRTLIIYYSAWIQTLLSELGPNWTKLFCLYWAMINVFPTAESEFLVKNPSKVKKAVWESKHNECCVNV